MYLFAVFILQLYMLYLVYVLWQVGMGSFMLESCEQIISLKRHALSSSPCKTCDGQQRKHDGNTHRKSHFALSMLEHGDTSTIE